MSKAKRPWMKWYPADWRADPGLRMCSFAARGLWADVLALMHEAEPYGHLLVNGRQPTPQQLASLLGGTAKEIERLIAELEAAGVPSRTDDGTLYSRRMVRDSERAETDKANGNLGGNPSLKRGVNPPDKAHKPEARSQKPEGEVAQQQATPPAPDPANDAALRLIAAFDAAQEAVFAEQRRPWPAQTDLSAARRMLAAGFAEADAKPLFEGLLQRMKGSGKAAPKALAYVEGAVAEHLAALKAPLPVPDAPMPNLPAFLDRWPQQPAPLVDPDRLRRLGDIAERNRLQALEENANG